MEATMPARAAHHHHEAATLPPGFRFHPTDEELILHYLRNRAASMPCPVPIIADVDIYKFDPWDLPCKAVYGDGEWYFFSPRDRKYPNGIRPNRAAGSGYWKATGTDKPIHDNATGESVGVKKALVFYKGRPPKGTKTSWIMHEYRLAAASPLAASAYRPPPVKFRNVSMRLDDWVLCRIYKKSGQASSPMVPPLADYDHLLEDHDEHSSGGGGFVDDSIYAPPASSGTTTTTCSSVNTTTHNQQHAASRELPTVPPSVISDLFFDDYSLAQIFDTAAVPLPLDADQHAQPFAMMHPSLNQLLTVGGGDSDSAWRYSSSELVYSSDYPAGAAAAPPVGGVAKRKATSPADDAGGNKRLHVSRFDWDTLLDADLESDALGWQYISGSLPDGRELDRIDNPQFEGYKFDPHGEYVRRWLPELARLPTEWIHHPWDAPSSVLQAAGVELGSNYPRPIVELDAANSRLQDALSKMWELEAASRAAIENGMEEGLGDSSEVPPIDFPQELQMEVDREPVRTAIRTPMMAGRRREDQMVPSMTSSLVRAETELTADFGNNSEDSRPEVPSNAHLQPRIEREETVEDGTSNAVRMNGFHQQHNLQRTLHRMQGAAPTTSEASSSWTGREGGVVPVWSPPSASGHSDPYTADEADISSRSYLDRHPQSHSMMNWSQVSQSLTTGWKEDS